MSARAKRAATRAPDSGGRVALFLTVAVTAAYLGVLATKWASAPPPLATDLIPLGVFLGGAAVLGGLFRIAGLQGAQALLIPALLLYGTGVAVQFRFGLQQATRVDLATQQAALIGMAGCALAALSFRGDAGNRLLRAIAPLCYLAALAVLVATAVIGQRFRGGMFLPGGINPTEIVKVLLVIAVAPYLASQKKELAVTAGGLPVPSPRVALTLGVIWLLPMLGLVYLRDLGMLILCCGALGVMLYAATERRGYLVVGLALVVAVTAIGYHVTPHIGTRVLAWRDPFRDPTGAGWQTLQSLSALYTGGALGRGLGAGSPQLIPVASTDFVYAVIGEELGFVGCLIVVGTFLVLLRAAFETAARQADDSRRILTTGLAAMLAVQAILNIGGVTKAIPVTGVPLPFVSHGGSSLVTSFLMLGLLIAASAPGGGGGGGGSRKRKRKR